MTDQYDRLPDEYQDKIETLENELGREICGFPTEELEPCELWPADESGRCSRHGDSNLDEVLEENQPTSVESPKSLEPDETLRTPDHPIQSTPPRAPLNELIETLQSSLVYWICLVVVGLSFGAGTTALTMDFDRSTPEPQDNTSVRINFEDPDFNRIRQMYRNGNYSRVMMSLGKIIENAPTRQIKARGMYYSFIFHQKRKNYQQALDVADRFIKQFKDHHRRAEIIYGAWFISSQFLNDSDRAKSYRKSLLEEYPDTKWAKRLSS